MKVIINIRNIEGGSITTGPIDFKRKIREYLNNYSPTNIAT